MLPRGQNALRRSTVLPVNVENIGRFGNQRLNFDFQSHHGASFISPLFLYSDIVVKLAHQAISKSFLKIIGNESELHLPDLIWAACTVASHRLRRNMHHFLVGVVHGDDLPSCNKFTDIPGCKGLSTSK